MNAAADRQHFWLLLILRLNFHVDLNGNCGGGGSLSEGSVSRHGVAAGTGVELTVEFQFKGSSTIWSYLRIVMRTLDFQWWGHAEEPFAEGYFLLLAVFSSTWLRALKSNAPQVLWASLQAPLDNLKIVERSQTWWTPNYSLQRLHNSKSYLKAANTNRHWIPVESTAKC